MKCLWIKGCVSIAGTNQCYVGLTPITESKISVLVVAYYITHPLIIKALIDAHNRGVQVEVVMDKSQLKSKWSGLRKFKNASVPCFIDNKPKIQHNKFMIIDHRLLLTGSYNWTKNAENRNAENIVFIENNIEIVKRYHDYFMRRQRLSMAA